MSEGASETPPAQPPPDGNPRRDPEPELAEPGQPLEPEEIIAK